MLKKRVYKVKGVTGRAHMEHRYRISSVIIVVPLFFNNLINVLVKKMRIEKELFFVKCVVAKWSKFMLK